MKLSSILLPMTTVVLVGTLAACAATYSANAPKAFAQIAPTSVATGAGMNPSGRVSFVQTDQGVMVSGSISGLRPNQEHGFHVHEGADCSGDGLSTKGHFNPDGSAHGKHGDAAQHAGDLPALKADARGVAEFSFLAQKFTVAAGPRSIVGRGLVVHRDPDDYKTQPTGNAGPRPGCAMIQAG